MVYSQDKLRRQPWSNMVDSKYVQGLGPMMDSKYLQSLGLMVYSKY